MSKTWRKPRLGRLLAPKHRCWFFTALATLAILGLVASPLVADDGILETVRTDVRDGAPSSPSPPAQKPQQQSTTPDRPTPDDGSTASDLASSVESSAGGAVLIGIGVVALSPLFVPHIILDDKISNCGYFLRYPYEYNDGYIRKNRSPEDSPLAVRLDVEYDATFDRLDDLAGHLLISTSSRFGLAASFNHLEERLADGGRDRMQIGDCNLVYRFAQAEWAEFRIGLGANWLNDSGGTNLGFNFYYAVDLYLRKPWVLSSELDAGTLGHAGLFRSRTTVGIVCHGIVHRLRVHRYRPGALERSGRRFATLVLTATTLYCANVNKAGGRRTNLRAQSSYCR